MKKRRVNSSGPKSQYFNTGNYRRTKWGCLYTVRCGYADLAGTRGGLCKGEAVIFWDRRPATQSDSSRACVMAACTQQPVSYPDSQHPPPIRTRSRQQRPRRLGGHPCDRSACSRPSGTGTRTKLQRDKLRTKVCRTYNGTKVFPAHPPATSQIAKYLER